MAKLIELKLKKGDTVFLYGSWNGHENTTIDFYIQEYTIHSIGKSRCYLLYGNNINSKKEYCSISEIKAAINMSDALGKCKEFQPDYIDDAIKYYERMLNNVDRNKDYNKSYIEHIERILNNLKNAERRIIINPYTDKSKKILE